MILITILPLISKTLLDNIEYRDYFDIVEGKKQLLKRNNQLTITSQKFDIIGSKDVDILYSGGSGVDIYEYNSKIKLKRYIFGNN
jgi:hypothetical protein